MAQRTKDELLKDLSDALLKISPLGGSELFIQFEDKYYADPVYCGFLIEQMRHKLHEERIENAHLRKMLREK